MGIFLLIPLLCEHEIVGVEQKSCVLKWQDYDFH